MFIIISGPSGSGKTPIVYSLMEAFPNIKKVQSYTTRPIRAKEVTGTYIYVSKAEFEEKIKQGFFLEYNKVHKDQQYYGTGMDSFIGASTNGFVALKDIDVDSYKDLKENHKDLDIVGIYVTVKDRDVLFKRLRERGESEHTIEIRLHDRVDYENSQQNFYDYVVYTDDINDAIEKVVDIVNKEFKKRKIKVKANKLKRNKKHMF